MSTLARRRMRRAAQAAGPAWTPAVSASTFEVVVLKLARNVRPEKRLDDSFKARWDKIAQRKPPYDKSAFAEDKRVVVGDVLPGKLAPDGLAQAPLLYTAVYAEEGKAEHKAVEAKLDAFLENLKVREY
jgi:hypothetical protein